MKYAVYKRNMEAVRRVLEKYPLSTIERIAKKLKGKRAGYDRRGHGAWAIKLELILMLNQNPRHFKPENVFEGSATLWSAREQPESVPQPKEPKAAQQKIKLLPPLKNLYFAKDQQELVLGVLKAHGFCIRYTDLWHEVFEEAKKEDFDQRSVNEAGVRQIVSNYLSILSHNGIIRLAEMGESILPGNLSELKSWEKFRNEQEPELDFDDEETVEAELEKEARKESPQIDAETSQNSNSDSEGGNEQEDMPSTAFMEKFNRRLNAIVGDLSP